MHPYLTHGGGGAQLPMAQPADHVPGLQTAPGAKRGETRTSAENLRSEHTVGLAGFKKQKAKRSAVSWPAYSFTVGSEAEQGN